VLCVFIIFASDLITEVRAVSLFLGIHRNTVKKYWDVSSCELPNDDPTWTKAPDRAYSHFSLSGIVGVRQRFFVNFVMA